MGHLSYAFMTLKHIICITAPVGKNAKYPFELRSGKLHLFLIRYSMLPGLTFFVSTGTRWIGQRASVLNDSRTDHSSTDPTRIYPTTRLDSVGRGQRLAFKALTFQLQVAISASASARRRRTLAFFPFFTSQQPPICPGERPIPPLSARLPTPQLSRVSSSWSPTRSAPIANETSVSLFQTPPWDGPD